MDKEKNLPASKEADKEKEKKKNEKNSLKAAAAKKPKKGIRTFFREAKSEFKKVVWPSRKQVVNNTIVVLSTIVLTGIAIFGLDELFTFLIKLLLAK
jgi:preprotein translocase subunit SecE